MKTSTGKLIFSFSFENRKTVSKKKKFSSETGAPYFAFSYWFSMFQWLTVGKLTFDDVIKFIEPIFSP
jgi:hypothetical protein